MVGEISCIGLSFGSEKAVLIRNYVIFNLLVLHCCNIK